MPAPVDRPRRFPEGPELVSLAVLVLAALLIAIALSYSWIATGGRAVEAGPEPAARGCTTMASCDGDRRISPGHDASMK